jgi:RNA polymerase sigma-70 factor (ECF subfamily)
MRDVLEAASSRVLSVKLKSMLLNGLVLALELSQEGGSDAELAERLKKRDPDAMTVLYDRFGRLAYSVIVGIVHDSAIAEDLMQETFLRVWNRVQAFDSERGALGAWLLAVARNRAIDYVRSAGARMALNCFELEEREHPSLFVDMERELVSEDNARLVRNALAQLNANQKKVVELAYYEGLSQTEMAERLGEPLGTVKTWARTALKVLRDELSKAAAV